MIEKYENNVGDKDMDVPETGIQKVDNLEKSSYEKGVDELYKDIIRAEAAMDYSYVTNNMENLKKSAIIASENRAKSADIDDSKENKTGYTESRKLFKEQAEERSKRLSTEEIEEFSEYTDRDSGLNNIKGLDTRGLLLKYVREIDGIESKQKNENLTDDSFPNKYTKLEGLVEAAVNNGDTNLIGLVNNLEGRLKLPNSITDKIKSFVLSQELKK